MSFFQLPAGMTHTHPDYRFAFIPYRTRFYSELKSDVLVNADFLDSSYKIPAGGWLSSAENMARFEVAMFHETSCGLRRRLPTGRNLVMAPVGKRAKILVFSTVGHDGGQQGTSPLLSR
jgi:CubicO group peptidase (beta-lactamase class C family)